MSAINSVKVCSIYLDEMIFTTSCLSKHIKYENYAEADAAGSLVGHGRHGY